MAITYYLFFICLISFSTNFAYSQISPSYCTYNGIDYSRLNNGSYSSLSAASGSNPAGKYRFFWNICGEAIKCDSSGVSACQLAVGSIFSATTVGLMSLGSFSMFDSVTPILHYTTNSNPCNDNIFRSFDILLSCSTGEIESSIVIEESKCSYRVLMSGQALCATPTPTPTTPTPTLTPTPTPTSNNVTCQASNGISMKSPDTITCSGYGPSICTTPSGYLCESVNTDSVIKCISPDHSISCIGNHFECYTTSYSCSIDLSSYNGLEVNGKIINSNYFSSPVLSPNSNANNSYIIIPSFIYLVFFIIQILFL
ncbi:hypothetical protein RB653_000565 [Dictyostelium firmibasis]|uniref:MRH domain-containing protein n=1 Tax=Dictyostelium firmibasis TaxID=79012 RepID=A0AAN7U755_9MYCE